MPLAIAAVATVWFAFWGYGSRWGGFAYGAVMMLALPLALILIWCNYLDNLNFPIIPNVIIPEARKRGMKVFPELMEPFFKYAGHGSASAVDNRMASSTF